MKSLNPNIFKSTRLCFDTNLIFEVIIATLTGVSVFILYRYQFDKSIIVGASIKYPSTDIDPITNLIIINW